MDDRSGWHMPWGLAQIAITAVACALTLMFGAGVGVRGLAASIGVIAVLLAISFISRGAAPARAAARIALVAALASPWLLGLGNNTLQGWQDHVLYWGRDYNLSSRPPDGELVASSPELSVLTLAGGSTWVPNPLIEAPTVLVVRLPTGDLVSYGLVGGP